MKKLVFIVTSLWLVFFGSVSNAQTFPFDVSEFFAYYKIPDDIRPQLQTFSPYIFLSGEKCVANGKGVATKKQSIAYWPMGQVQHGCWSEYKQIIMVCPIYKEKTGPIGNACIDIHSNRFLDTINIPVAANFGNKNKIKSAPKEVPLASPVAPNNKNTTNIPEWCSNAKLPHELTICADPELSKNESKILRLYPYFKKDTNLDTAQLREHNRIIFNRIKACEYNKECILKEQNERLDSYQDFAPKDTEVEVLAANPRSPPSPPVPVAAPVPVSGKNVANAVALLGLPPVATKADFIKYFGSCGIDTSMQKLGSDLLFGAAFTCIATHSTQCASDMKVDACNQIRFAFNADESTAWAFLTLAYSNNDAKSIQTYKLAYGDQESANKSAGGLIFFENFWNPPNLRIEITSIIDAENPKNPKNTDLIYVMSKATKLAQTKSVTTAPKIEPPTPTDDPTIPAKFGKWLFTDGSDNSCVVTSTTINKLKPHHIKITGFKPQRGQRQQERNQLLIELLKDGFNSSEHANSAVVFDFFDGKPWDLEVSKTRSAYPNRVSAGVPESEIETFLDDLDNQPKLKITFPNVNELPWAVDNASANQALINFDDCMSRDK